MTLDRCLAAILAAELPPEEIIVVRAPGMPAAIGPGVVSVDSPAFGGPAAARNAGAQIATGDVLVFVDADVANQAGRLRTDAIVVRRPRRRCGVRLVLRPAAAMLVTAGGLTRDCGTSRTSSSDAGSWRRARRSSWIPRSRART